MKAYLHYDAYYEVELPDIGTNTFPFQTAVNDLKRHVEEDLLDEDWIVEFLGVIED